MAPSIKASGRLEADICVVGGGIVGLAHAHEALRRGLRVVLLERERRAVGASVRNFGHVFVAALADGESLECGLRSRERWLELGPRAGLSPIQAGTLVVARAGDEQAILEHAAANPSRGARMVTRSEVADLAPIPTDEVVGGMHGTLDLRVDPRAAVAGLGRLLEEDPRAEVRFQTPVHAVEPGVVYGDGVTVRAPLVLVCPGPDFGWLAPGLRVGLEMLSLCRLQMLRVSPPDGRRYGPALVTGLSLIRYPAFAGLPEARALRERLLAERPELLEAGIHLLVTQLPGGDLVIGDTHDYDGCVSPFGEERLYELLLAEARRLLGAAELSVRERWHGIYPTGPEGHFVTTQPMEGVRVVEVVSGLGMTMSLGHAATVVDELVAAGSPNAALTA